MPGKVEEIDCLLEGIDSFKKGAFGLLKGTCDLMKDDDFDYLIDSLFDLDASGLLDLLELLVRESDRGSRRLRALGILKIRYRLDFDEVVKRVKFIESHKATQLFNSSSDFLPQIKKSLDEYLGRDPLPDYLARSLTSAKMESVRLLPLSLSVDNEYGTSALLAKCKFVLLLEPSSIPIDWEPEWEGEVSVSITGRTKFELKDFVLRSFGGG